VLQLALGGFGLYQATRAIKNYHRVYGNEGGKSSLLVSAAAADAFYVMQHMQLSPSCASFQSMHFTSARIPHSYCI
jgi:hypothetical protein